MRKVIIFQTRQRVQHLLDRKHEKANLRKLKQARYMREDYRKKKKCPKITLDEQEYRMLQKLAENSGVKTATFIREMVLAYLKDERVPAQELLEEQRKTNVYLCNIANNMNQVARQCNTYKKALLGDILMTRGLMKDLRQFAEQKIRKL